MRDKEKRCGGADGKRVMTLKSKRIERQSAKAEEGGCTQGTKHVPTREGEQQCN